MKFLTILLAIVALALDNATAVSFEDFYRGPDADEMSIDEPAVGPNDGSTPIYLSPSLPYYGIQYNCAIVYVGGRVGLYIDSTPEPDDYKPCFHGENNTAEIAPFNGSIMISEGSSVNYSNTTDSSLRNKVAEQINNFTDFNDITLKYLLIATWKNVTIGDGKNTFQVVIATDGTKSFALFLYDKLAIETMDTTNPRVYFNGTDCNDESVLWEMPCSETSNITAMANTSNVEVLGMWAFRIDKDITPACTNKESCEEDGLCSCLLDDTSQECLCNCTTETCDVEDNTMCSSVAMVVVGFSQELYSVVEDEGAMVMVCVSILSQTGDREEFEVTLTTVDGSASAPMDYTALSEDLVFPVGFAVACINISITDDNILETNEVFTAFITSDVAEIEPGLEVTTILIQDIDEAGDRSGSSITNMSVGITLLLWHCWFF